MRGLIGAAAGAVFGIVAAYLVALIANSEEPLFVVFVPVGLAFGWLAGRRWGSVTTCPFCSREVGKTATVCPSCGNATVVEGLDL